MEPHPPSELYPPTQYSKIRLVQTADDPQVRREALGYIVTTYRPVFIQQLTRKGLSEIEAEELAQGFLAHVLEHDKINHYAQARGQFRRFIGRALKNYVIDQRRKGRPVTMLEDGDQWLADESESDPYDLEWALFTLQQTYERMRQECLHTGNMHHWKVFEVRVLGVAAGEPELSDREILARHGSEFGFTKEKQVNNAFVNAKRLFERKFREVIADYEGEEADIEQEARFLREVLARSRW